MLHKGSVVQFKEDIIFVGIVEDISSTTIYIRYLKIDRNLGHNNTNYGIDNFLKYWEVIN